MRRQIIPVLALITTMVALPPANAQTISARPAFFKDPVWGVEPKQGDVVLGRTTLKAALRIFAVELEEDSVRVPLGHKGNPSTLDATELRIGGVTFRPRYRLDLGPSRYALYFDKHERLVAVNSHRLDRWLTRKELAEKYPSLRVYHRGRTADGDPVYDGLAAPLGECVSLAAEAWANRGGVVESIGYVYTCPTTSGREKSK
jgi:hypothetical protein